MALISKLRRMVQSKRTIALRRFSLVRTALTMNPHPIAGGAPEAGESGAGDGDGAGDGAGGEAGSGDGAGSGSGDGASGDGGDGEDDAIKADDDWKEKARKHEKSSKKKDDAIADLQSKLQKFEDANKSENQKAIDKAKKEARDEAETEFSTERRADRLAVAVSAHAREVADVEDVILNINKAIKDGDIDATDIFDKGDKVNTKELKSALEALLKRKPHLKAGPNGQSAGDGDAGKGSGSSGSSGGFNDKIREQASR